MRKLLVLFLMTAVAFAAFGEGKAEGGTGAPSVVTYKAYTGPNTEDLDYS